VRDSPDLAGTSSAIQTTPGRAPAVSGHARIIDTFEEAEEPASSAWKKPIVIAVDDRGDPPNHAALLAGQKKLGLPVA